MTLNFKFKINQRVKMKELKWHGTVKSIWVTAKSTQYQIRYFWDGEGKEVYFYEEELDPEEVADAL